MTRIQDVLEDVPVAVRRKGFSHVVRHGTRYLRGRLPRELWTHAHVSTDPESEAAAVIDLFDPEAIEVKYDGIHTLPPQLDYYNRRITPVEGTVYRFDDVDVIGSTPIVGLGDRYPKSRYFSASWFGVTVSFFTRQMDEIKRSLPLFLHYRQRVGRSTGVEQINCGFLLLSEWGSGFFHWFYETLPKLWWFEKLNDVISESPLIICHSPLQEYQRRSLELMGYSSDSIVKHPSRRSEVNQLYLAPHPMRVRGRQIRALPSQLKWVGERIKSNVSTTGESGRRVYVSRQDADRRRVTNEDDLMDGLSDLGFERYEPGRLSLEEQIRLFANASIVVGPHGKAFTNLLYAEDCTLIELFPERGADATYFMASEELDLEYDFVECQTPDRTDNEPARDNDLIAPVREVLRTVDEYL